MGDSHGASDEGLCAALEAVPVPAVIARREDLVLLFVNQPFVDTVGLSREACLGRSAAEFYDGLGEQEEELGERLEREGRVDGFEVAARMDGRLIYFLVSMQPLVFQDQPCVLVGLIDVTKQRLARERLRRMLDLGEQDRRWVALEIHDGVVQEMTGALLLVEAAINSLDTQRKTESLGHLKSAARLLQSGIADARGLINGLRPPVLEERGLVAALENLVEEMSTTSGIAIHLQCETTESAFPPDLETAMYRVVQEALNNAWKHSGAGTVDVQLHQRENQLQATISDHGRGFDLSSVDQGRHGLSSIRERAEALGGRARIVSTPGMGATVFVSLPLRGLTEDGS